MLTPSNEGFYNDYLKDFKVKKNRIVFGDGKTHPEEEFKEPLLNSQTPQLDLSED
jgi:hypothetical protein